VWDIANVTGTFFANVTTVFTLPAGLKANALGNNKVATTAPSRGNELVPEVVVTEPLSPQKPGTTDNSEGYGIPWNCTVEHALKNGKEVTTITGPDGKPVSWTEDERSAKIAVPGNRELPATSVYVVPSEAHIDQLNTAKVVASDPKSLDPALSVQSDTFRTATHSDSSGIYYPGKGGVVATTLGDNIFMTPLVQSGIQSESESSYKYMKRYFGGQKELNILCDGVGDTFQCAGLFTNGTLLLQSTPSTSGKYLDFTLMPSAISDPQLEISAKAIAMRNGNGISYTFSTTSSHTIPQINITPMVFTSAMENRSIVYRGPDMICYNTDHCSASGNYEVTEAGDYFAHGYVTFTTPDSFANAGSPKNLYLVPDSDLISFDRPSDRVGTMASIKQIGGKDIYLWGLASANQNMNDPGNTAFVNVVIYNKNRYFFMDELTKKSGGIWHRGAGSGGNGYSGQSEPKMTWKGVLWGDNDHLEKGEFLNNKDSGGRIHCPLFDGGNSSSLGNKWWTFTGCHHEYWVWGTIWNAYSDSTHVAYNKYYDDGHIGYDEGKTEFYNDLVTYSLIDSGHSNDVYFDDYDENYHDGYAWVLSGK
jgi:hypothetical protein